MTRLALVAALLAARTVHAHDTDPLAGVTDVQDLSLSDLLDTHVAVAAQRPQTTRETPGIVTVISRDDIARSGARELLDVLALVPGFSTGVDIAGVVGLGVRGQWAHEGKVLLLIDGQAMNELLYSTLQLGNHYPIESIDHIEVIRGPGSVIYGGYAELAVINLVSRDAATLDGVAVAGSYGRLAGGTGHANATLTFATDDTGVPGFTLSGAFMIGHAATRGTYADFADRSYALARASDRDPLFFRAAAGYRGLRVDAIVDDYATTGRDSYGRVDPVTTHMAFRTLALAAHYDVAVREGVTLTPRFSVVRQTPWQVIDPMSTIYYAKRITRYAPGVTLSVDPLPRLNVLAGVEAYFDRAHVDATGERPRLFSGKYRDRAYDTIATYAQVIASHPLANLTVGARYEHQGRVGSSLVPRIALTKVVGAFHAKLLASQAFRAPGVENISVSDGNIDAEKTTAFEAELGYAFGDHMFLAGNAFDTTIDHPIVYEYDQAAAREVYQNFRHTGTRGVELDYRIRYPRASAALTYSFYTAAGKNAVDAYAVPGHDDVLLAAPAHKLTATASLALTSHLTLNPSAIVHGPRYGYTSGDGAGNGVLGREPTTVLANLYLLSRGAWLPGLELGAGVFNLADQRDVYLQPYTGGHAPLPAPGRELVVRAGYELAW